jgi:hypothetical protein
MILISRSGERKARCAECERLYVMAPREAGSWHLCAPCRKAIDEHLKRYGWANARRPELRRQA